MKVIIEMDDGSMVRLLTHEDAQRVKAIVGCDACVFGYYKEDDEDFWCGMSEKLLGYVSTVCDTGCWRSSDDPVWELVDGAAGDAVSEQLTVDSGQQNK